MHFLPSGKVYFNAFDRGQEVYALCGQQFRGYSCRSWSLNEGRLGCRSHMFESSFFSARSAYKKLLELCAGTPNRHILNQALRQTRMVSWLSAYGAHYAPAVKSFEEQLQSRKAKNASDKSRLYGQVYEPRLYELMCITNFEGCHL